MIDPLKKWYPVLLALVGALVSAMVYSRLPETVAVHWDLNGNPNGWMPRPIGAFFGPVFIVVLWQLLRLAPRIDPREANYERFGPAYETIVASALVLMLAIHLVVLGLALGYHLPLGRLVPAMIGVLYLVIGNVMPRTRSNWWFGVRTPWTLSSDRVWTRTHRLAGYSMTGAGLVMLLAALALPAALGIPLAVAVSIAAVAAPAVYSYLSWRREQRG
jgi:immunity protein, SdpI family